MLKMLHLKSRNERLQRLLIRDEQERTVNTKCAEEVHDCLEAN